MTSPWPTRKPWSWRGPWSWRKQRRREWAIVPVDSEHSAIFQCLRGNRRGDVRRIMLTASGGPFLHASAEEMAAATPAQALCHPNWTMGRKITIDSATMMNKGLEVIEAHWLFDMPVAAIDVLIHPQSIIHSLVEYRDGSVIAQLGMPDMRIPIAYALSFPLRLNRSEPVLDLLKIGRLDFSKPDQERFPSLKLACEAASRGGTLPAVLNAANEIAVEAYLGEEIGFMEICHVIKAVMSHHQTQLSPVLSQIIEADRWARDEAGRTIKGMKN